MTLSTLLILAVCRAPVTWTSWYTSLTVESRLCLNGWASERGIRGSEVWFLMGTQNFCFVSCSWQDEKRLSLFLIRAILSTISVILLTVIIFSMPRKFLEHFVYHTIPIIFCCRCCNFVLMIGVGHVAYSPSSTSCGALILVRVFRSDTAFDKFRCDYISTLKQGNNNHSFNKQEEGHYLL